MNPLWQQDHDRQLDADNEQPLSAGLTPEQAMDALKQSLEAAQAPHAWVCICGAHGSVTGTGERLLAKILAQHDMEHGSCRVPLLALDQPQNYDFGMTEVGACTK